MLVVEKVSEDETNKVKEKHRLFLAELDGFSLCQAKHILQCVSEDLEAVSVIRSGSVREGT
jgi:hypothetical protein